MLTIKDLQTRWQLSDVTIRRKIREGEIQVTRIGRAIRISPEEVERVEKLWANRPYNKGVYK